MIYSLRTLLFSFAGRINRAAYWTRAFPLLLAYGLIVNSVLALEYKLTGAQGVASLALTLFGLWPILAVPVKRLHDRARSAWFLLVFLVPVVGPIWLLVEVWFLPGTDGANRFGDVPRDVGLDRRWVIPFAAVGVAAQTFLLAWVYLPPPGTLLQRALIANGYQLIRMEAPVSGPVAVPAGNSLILMRVDGSASIGDVAIVGCMDYDMDRTEAQACRLNVPASKGFENLVILIGTPHMTPAFSMSTANGRVIVILSSNFLGPDPPNRNVGWIIEELKRPGRLF
ncbi:MAG: DUF805 domain-containing protein [Burkholderiales bacterium]|nr:DUF805 domain-containing protein [Burkholderiales bacterium]